MYTIDTLIKNHIYCVQTDLVRHMLAEDCIAEDPDWIGRLTHPNFYYQDDKGDSHEKDIWQWLLVSPWLAAHLEAVEEPVLPLYSYWWGRTQQQILCDIEEDETLLRIVRKVVYQRTSRKLKKGAVND